MLNVECDQLAIALIKRLNMPVKFVSAGSDFLNCEL